MLAGRRLGVSDAPPAEAAVLLPRAVHAARRAAGRQQGGAAEHGLLPSARKAAAAASGPAASLARHRHTNTAAEETSPLPVVPEFPLALRRARLLVRDAAQHLAQQALLQRPAGRQHGLCVRILLLRKKQKNKPTKVGCMARARRHSPAASTAVRQPTRAGPCSAAAAPVVPPAAQGGGRLGPWQTCKWLSTAVLLRWSSRSHA